MENITIPHPFEAFPMVPIKKLPALFETCFWRREPPTVDLSGLDEQTMAQVSFLPSNNQYVLQESVQKWTISMYYQALFSELVDLIKKNQLPKIEPTKQAFTSPSGDTAHASMWHYKLSSSQFGSQGVFNDLCSLAHELSKNMKVPLGYLTSTRNLFLMVPDSHMPYLLAKTGSSCSALDMLQAAFPYLKLMCVPELKAEDKGYALLACYDDVYGYPGFFAHKEVSALPSEAETKDLSQVPYKLKLPPHKLIITNPEQIAVLTGI